MSFRSRSKGFFSRAKITRGAFYLFCLEVGLSLVALFSNDDGQAWIVRNLVASDVTVWRDLKVWTLVSTMFVEPRFIALLFHGMMLWMFVPALERWWGTKRFLMFAIGVSATAALVGTLAGSFMGDPGTHVIAGLDAMIFACIVAYGVVYAKTQVYFFAVLPLTGKQLAWGMSGFVALMVVLNGDWSTGAGWAAAMLLALALTSEVLSPRLMWLRWRHRRVRRHLKLVPDDDKKKRWMN